MPVLTRKPGALRNGAPFKDWVLPAAMERVRRKLASVDDGNRQMVDILAAVLTDGLPAVRMARSTPRNCKRARACLRATLSWWRKSRFSASSHRRDLNKLPTRIANARNNVIIAADHATILALPANTPRMEFSERTGGH